MQVLLINGEIIRLDLVAHVVPLVDNVRFYLVCSEEYTVRDIYMEGETSVPFVAALAKLMADGASGEYVEAAKHIRRLDSE